MNNWLTLIYDWLILMYDPLIFIASVSYVIYFFVKAHRRKIKVRKRGPRATSSRIWREMYSKRVFSVVPIEPVEVSEMYLLTFTEASEKRKSDIERIINSTNYKRLTGLMDKIPMFVGDFGKDYNCDIYDVIGIQKKTNQFFLAVLFSETKKEGTCKLQFVKEISTLKFEKFVRRRRLIYPV